MQRVDFFFLIFLSTLIYLTPGYSQNTFDGLIIRADSGERNLESKSMELNGNIQIIFKGQHLSADKAIIYQNRKEFIAEGHVLLVTPKATLGGTKLTMNYETNDATVYSGFIQSGQVIFEGSIIEKKGEDQYLTTDSQYTSCTTCPAAWSFSGQTIEAQIGGYALIKNSILRFGTVPVFWLPYLIVPLKSERQTGLLTPIITFSQKGRFSISQPFFWAISDNQDATFTFQNFETRGLKVLSNYRYALSEESSGEFDFSFIRDNAFGHSNRYTNFLPETNKVNRWYMHYSHYWKLPNDWIQRTNVNNLSDLQYPNDFRFETPLSGDPAMETRISLTKNTYDRHFSVDNSYYINTLKGHPTSNNRDSVHRLPEINLSSTRKPIGETGFLINYDLKYTHFARNDFAYDDLDTLGTGSNQYRHVRYQCSDGSSTGGNKEWENNPHCEPKRDGKFNPGSDLIRSGQRLIFEPSLTRPMQLGTLFNFVPKVSFRESHYSFGIDGVPDLSRRFLRTEFKLQTSFSRIFGNLDDPKSDRYKHEFQPEIITTAIPWLNQPDHPFWGFGQNSEVPFYSRETVSDSDLFGDNGIQFDYNDRLFDRNLITYRFTNKIIRKTSAENQPANYDRLVTWRLSQTYDVHEAQRGMDRQPWSDIESILSIRLAHFNTYTKINFFPYQKLSNTTSSVTLNDDNGNYIKLGLERNYTPNLDGRVDVKERIEDYMLQLGTTARNVNFVGRVVYNGNDFTAERDKTRIKSLTSAVIIRPPGNCWGFQFVQSHDISREKDDFFEFQLDFLFDGKTSTKSPIELLKKFGF